MTETRDTVILGSGCAGLTAAIYTARANLKPLVLEGPRAGRPALHYLAGGELSGMAGRHPGAGADRQHEEAGGAFRRGRFSWRIWTAWNWARIRFGCTRRRARSMTRTLIIASGASARWLGLPSEQALIGHGVSSCATCDGFFFRGKEIAVVGGGDSAMEEALFLTRFASKVTLLHRRPAFRASKIMLERAMAHPNIEFRTNTVVDEVLGVEEKEVKGLRLRDVANGAARVLCTLMGCFSGSATSRTRRCLPGRSIWTKRATSSRQGNVLRRARESLFRASTRAATCRIGAIGRRSRRRARAAWRRWKRRSISRSTGAETAWRP